MKLKWLVIWKLVIKIVKLNLDLEVLLFMKSKLMILIKITNPMIVFLMDMFYKLNTLKFKKANRSQYGNGCDFKHEIIQNRGNNCFIPTKGIVSLNVLTF